MDGWMDSEYWYGWMKMNECIRNISMDEWMDKEY